MDRAKTIRARWEELDGDRAVFKTHWQQVSNYLHPERATYIVERAPGQKAMAWVYDETPLWAVDQFANGLHGFLTSTDVQWFGLHADDDRINQDYDCRAWLDAVAAAMYGIFSGTKHTFASQSHELYQDLGVIGTGVMAQLDSPRNGMTFQTRHLKECVVAENEEGRIDTVIRRFELTAKQAVQQWGPDAGPSVGKAIDDDKLDKKFWFLHRVTPRLARDPERADARNKPFESVYVAEADDHEIAESGFDEFPFHVPRFAKSTNEIYGRSPGMRALPSIKMLNEMAKTVLKAAQKIIDPPLMVPDDGFMVPIKTLPGAINYYRAGLRPTDRLQPLQTHGDIPIGREMLNDYRQLILRAFYVDWFIMPSDMTDPAGDGKGITATFTNQQRQEKMRQASPMVARLQGEFLGPLIDRTFGMLWRKSKAMRFGPGSPFPAPPEKLKGQPIHPEYLSPLAIAQQTSELQAVEGLIQTALGLTQIDPTAARPIDAEAILRLRSRLTNAPAVALKSPERVQAEIQAEAARQRQAEQAAQAQQLAGAAKDGSGALQNLASMNAQASALGVRGQGLALPQPAQAAA